MPSSLICEHHIVITASLAATLGLEEAVMLQVLGECLKHRMADYRDGYRWVTLAKQDALALMPFWSEQDIDRLSQKLQNQGIIRLASPSLLLTDALIFTLNETVAAPQPEALQAKPAAVMPLAKKRSRKTGSRPIPSDWEPGPELLRKLQELNGIPSAFALELVPEFVTYWHDRQATTFSWESRFMNHAQRLWLQQGSPRDGIETAATSARQPVAIDDHWQPSEDALGILVRSGIDQGFVGEAVPEFILYWRERGDVCNTWDSRFIAHIRRQWARYESNNQFNTEPQRISSDWQPSEDVYDILRMANIDVSFARELLPEFIIYWRDTNQVYSSWNSRFLQHVKTRWARRLNGQEQSLQDHGKRPQTAAEPDRRSFVDKHTDQSWREGL